VKRESNVSTPFMEKLREELADLNGVVIKHYDASRIGLVDCSVTIPDHRFTLWLEFKLWIPPKKWDGVTVPYLKIAHAEKGVQLATARSLNALYIFWVNKSAHVTLWDPRTESPVLPPANKTSEMVTLVSLLIRAELGRR
jgi:hypothetical protein